MKTVFSKKDLAFLVDAMDRKIHSLPVEVESAAFADDFFEVKNSETDVAGQISGPMSVPKPVTVDVNGTMSEQDYKACSMVMAICQNMVQKSLTDAARDAGVEPAVALKDMNAWVKAYVDFPFPFFSFKDSQSDVFSKSDFSVKADPDTVESIVNIKGVKGLQDAVIGALKSSGGNLASYSNSDRTFNYFGIVTAYNETEIATRVIKFAMHMKTTSVDSLCVHYTKTNLDSAYDTYQFVCDKELMIKMQSKMGDKLADWMADQLLAFAKDFYAEALERFKASLAGALKGIKS
ncbi:hypothetical protein [Ralstonia solanacearum]|uniref:Uncharacterized protein n=1 Tax=Ralstonia solanacearum TaxID=305 RepID=A0AAD0WJ14_RALSL|nr:hypothetical protein [Ralstonia solanacearum]AXV84529.1 hypothetical protein CJO77_24030 [Ralstonia solanacearum]AXW55657.1 hypothetical protein CJO92_24045 [Ralstonia solanacearum]CBJ35928.1 hypothethical protein [Ralstonia solanacearum PSI07]